MKWANTFHAYLTDANVNAFVWWAGAMPTGNNESLIVLNPDRKGYSLTKRYETFGNYTRYITPGSQRIGTQLSQPTDSLLISAYKKNRLIPLLPSTTHPDRFSPEYNLQKCRFREL